MGMKSKKNFKPYTPDKKNTKKMKKTSQMKKNLLLKKRLKTLLKPSSSNSSKIEAKTDNSSKAVDSSLISSAINDKKFILHIESESDGYFKKDSSNIQSRNPSSAESDTPKVNGISPLNLPDTEVMKTKKKKSKKSKKRSRREEKLSSRADILKEVDNLECGFEDKIADEFETSETDTAFKESKKLKRQTTEVNYIAIQKPPKSKKLKNFVSKQRMADDDGWTVGNNDKNSKKKVKSKEKNVNPHKNGTFEASQDECSEPERKKPCKKSKQAKREKEKGSRSTEKRHKKSKKEKKFIIAPKEEACDAPVEEKEKFSDSDRSSYILQFFNDTAVDSTVENMDESESIYEDESDYNDYMSDSENEEEVEKSDDDGDDVKSSREKKKIEKSKKIKSNKNGKLMKKKKIKNSENLKNCLEEETGAKEKCLNMTTVADFLGEESLNDEEDEESVDDNECENSGDDEEDEKSVDDEDDEKFVTGNEGEDFDGDEEDEKSVGDEEDEKSAGDEEDEKSADDEEDEKSVDDEENEKSADDDEENETRGRNKKNKKSADDEENEKSAEDEEDEKSAEDEEDEKSADDEEDEKSADDEEDDRRLFNNWKNIEFFYDNFCSDDKNDRKSRNKKSSAKETIVKSRKAKPVIDESEDSDYCLTDDYGSEHSYETDEEEYDSYVDDEDSSFSLEYDDEEEASSFSEEEDDDGSYGYNFQEESDDEDYQLPEGEVEDVIVRPGKAKIYDMEGHNISFDSDSPQIIDLGNKSNQDESEAWKSTALVRVTSNNNKDNEESDDSCPQLVPINYDLPSSNYYDYDFSEDDEDMIDSLSDFDSGSSDEAAFSETECQDENDAKQISECKLLTTDGEKTIAYNLLGSNSHEENTTVEEEEKVAENTMKRTQEKSNVDRKPKKRKASDRHADEEQVKAQDPKRKVVQMDTEEDVEHDSSKVINPDIKVDCKIDNSQSNNMDVAQEATFSNSQIETEEIQNQYLREGTNSEQLSIRKPQGWQIEVNLKTKSLFFNSFHSRFVLILLKDYLYFNGALKIKLLLGSAEVFGYDLQRGEEVESYSIHGGAFLDLSPRTSKNSVTVEEIEKELSFYAQDFLSSDVKQIKKEFDKNRDALILLSRNDNTKKIEMVRRYMRENLFPTMTGLDVGSSSYTSQFILHSVFHNFDRNRCITFNCQWLDINLRADTKLAVIGGKSVGKSTLLRYTINRHLNKFKKILVIDLDIGQQEMFVPQTITATVVEKPILGPGYLFTNTPTKSLLFGHINVVISPLSYIRNVAELFKFCSEQNEFSDIPWVINTMGYTQGLGTELTAAVFNIAKPNLVVQIQSRKQKENYNCDMHTANVRRIRSALLSEWLNDLHNLSYELKIFKSVSGGGFGRFRMNAKDSRFCMILARLGTILKEQHDWLTDVRPYSVSYDDISIITYSEHFVEDKESLLDILNANLVYLCKKEANSETTECYGIGVVRGVDKAQRKVFIIASLEVETLSLVNTLAICNIPIPTSLLLNQGPKVKGAIPYTYNTQNNAFTKHIYQYNSAHFFKAGRNNR